MRWNLKVEVYNRRGAFIKELLDKQVLELDKKSLYRAFPVVNELSRFAEELERQVACKITNNHVLFKDLPMQHISILCRFSDKMTFIGSPSIPRSRRFSRLTKGDDIAFLYEVVKDPDNYALHLDNIRSPTGERGITTTISLYRLCRTKGCKNLAAPCSDEYMLCPFHCKSCEECSVKHEILEMASAYGMLLHDEEFLLNCLRQILDSHREDHLKSYIINYPLLNPTLKYALDEAPELGSIVRFKSAINAAYCLAMLYDRIPELVKKAFFELTEIGITKITGPLDYLVAYGHYGTNENFAIGFFSKVEPYRRNPIAITIKVNDIQRVLREYYPRLFIPLKCPGDFFKWFQRIESSLKTSSGEEQSEDIGERIFRMFGETIGNALGKQAVITDYGGGQGLVLFKFADNLLRRRRNVFLTLKLKDLSVRYLHESEGNARKMLGKHEGRFRLEPERCDIFKDSSIERGDVALISQVLDLYTELKPESQFKPAPIDDIYLELLRGVWSDHEAKEGWPETHSVALRLMSPYHYVIAKQVSDTDEPFQLDMLYELKLSPDPKVYKWLTNVCENTRYTIIVDRVMNKDLVEKAVGHTYSVTSEFVGRLCYTLVMRK